MAIGTMATKYTARQVIHSHMAQAAKSRKRLRQICQTYWARRLARVLSRARTDMEINDSAYRAGVRLKISVPNRSTVAWHAGGMSVVVSYCSTTAGPARAAPAPKWGRA